MRANGEAEPVITGGADAKDKFLAWARTVPHTLGNPLYHWTHLELSALFRHRPTLLNEETAEEIWEQTANAKLAEPELSVHGILEAV